MAQASRRGGGSGHPLLTGMSIGLLLGLCLALALALYLYRSNPFQPRAKEPPVKAAAKPESPKPPPAGMPTGELPPMPAPARTQESARFEFYDMLPESGGHGTGRTAPAAQGRQVYYLQAGSFQRPADADNLKAQLALAGLEAHIVTANIGDKGVWHRVRLGPFPDRAAMDGTLALLQENRIASQVITVTDEQPSGVH